MASNTSKPTFVKCSPTASEEAFLRAHEERQQNASNHAHPLQVPLLPPRFPGAEHQRNSALIQPIQSVANMDPMGSAFMMHPHDRTTTAADDDSKRQSDSHKNNRPSRRLSIFRSRSTRELSIRNTTSKPVPESLVRRDSMLQKSPSGRFNSPMSSPKLTSNKTDISPEARVFSNVELLERIFCELNSPLDLLYVQKANKACRKLITTSIQLRRKLYMAPSASSAHKLNPLLTTLGTISYLHPSYDMLMAHGVEHRTKGLILSYRRQLYRPECYFGYASNPSIHEDMNGQPYLQWELRKLTTLEAIQLDERVERIATGASLWKMYLCQSPVSEVHVTIWKKEEAEASDDSIFRAPQGTILARSTVRAWSVAAIFEAMEEAAARGSYTDVKHHEAGGDARSLRGKASGVFEKVSAKKLADKVKHSVKKNGSAYGSALSVGLGGRFNNQQGEATVFKMVP